MPQTYTSNEYADVTRTLNHGPSAKEVRKQPECSQSHDQDELYLPAEREAFFRRKYFVDRCVGGVLLVAMSPVLLILFLLVKLMSPGPGFYRQKRVGLHGEPFEIIKLRSMVVNAEKPGQAVWCVKNDARVTRFGRVLRKLHLDELPQLWNVARGEMSLVGPRPERPEICESLAEKIDGYYRRIAVHPGVTGLSQINLPPDEKFEDVQRKQILDLRYIEEANTWLEVRILVATAMRMVGIRGETVMKSMRLCRRDLLRSSERAVAITEGANHVEASFDEASESEQVAIAGNHPR